MANNSRISFWALFLGLSLLVGCGGGEGGGSQKLGGGGAGGEEDPVGMGGTGGEAGSAGEGGAGGEGGSGGGLGSACEPGETRSCYSGPAGTLDLGICQAGLQECLADGSGYGSCLGEQIPLREDCDGDDCSEACLLCEPGSVQPCYSGPEGSEGIGVCKAGEKECAADGLAFGRCLGQQLPQLEEFGLEVGNEEYSQACLQPRVLQVVTGFSHSCALLEGGLVKCWGNNSDASLGLGDKQKRGGAPGEMGAALPRVDLGTGVLAKALSSKGGQTCALLEGGGMKCWGANYSGQLGLGDEDDRGGAPEEMGDGLPELELGEGARVKVIAAGTSHTCALLEDGAIKCWGQNGSGQLGHASDSSVSWGRREGQMGDALPSVDLGPGERAVSLAAGSGHSCALLEAGRVKCWGANHYGELGIGAEGDRGVAAGSMGANLPVVDLGVGAKAKALALGSNHSCALLEDGKVKCWGANRNGQLGLGDDRDRGKLPEDMGDNLPAVKLGERAEVKALAAGSGFTCALLESGELKCWGGNSYGLLGQGDYDPRGSNPAHMGANLLPVKLGEVGKVEAISAGQDHVCAILESGGLKCWGANYNGQLGIGDKDNRGGDPADMGDALPFVELF